MQSASVHPPFAEPHERLRRARVAAGYRRAAEAAAALGVPAPTYAAHENGSRDFRANPDTVELYARKFKVALEWLAFGSGRPPPAAPRAALPAEEAEPTRIPIEEWDPANQGEDLGEAAPGAGGADGRLVYSPQAKGGRPEIDVTPGAGEGAVGEVVSIGVGAGGAISAHRVIGEWVFPSSFIRSELHAAQSATVVMAVKGDSMQPTLVPGDRVIVDLRQNAFGPDAVYVIDDGDGEPRVKRLRKVTASSPPEVEVVSDNPVQRSDRVQLDRIRVLGRVVGRVSRL